MIRKTYGVSGLMDWTTQIKVGKGAVSVHFTGGALTAYGVTPAKYSTSNVFFQNVIENSEQFKSGRIQLLSEMEVADDAAEKARKARLAAKAASMPIKEGQCSVQTSEEGQTTSDPDDAEQTQDATSGEHDGDSSDGGDGADGSIRVPDKMEAIEYLKEHFPEKGYTATKLRTQTAFQAACAECGVTFVFTA